MAEYVYDDYLEFLSKCTDEELQYLFEILVYDKDGEKRFSETLTTSSGCRKFGRNFSKYWEEIAGELQHYGGNTIANLFRGNGVEYEEILDDVMSELKIDTKYYYTVEEKEEALLENTLKGMLEGMSSEEKIRFAKEVGLKDLNMSKGAMALAVQGILKTGGFGVARLTGILAAYISRAAIGKAAVAGAGRLATVFTGPIGWGITGAWTLLDIASPAKRVTIPATIIVSCLRKNVIERERQAKEREEYKFIKCPECDVNLRCKKGSQKVKCPNCEAIIYL